MDKSTEEYQRYIQGIEFPASKEEVASSVESNGAPQYVVQKLRNADRERFDSSNFDLQEVRGSM